MNVDWVEVDTEMPEENEKVLVYCSEGVKEAVFVDGCFDEPFIGQEAIASFDEVTHWMKMPNEPQI